MPRAQSHERIAFAGIDSFARSNGQKKRLFYFFVSKNIVNRFWLRGVRYRMKIFL